MKLLALAILFAALGPTLFAEQPVYTIKLRATASFAPDASDGGTLSFYAPRLPSGVKSRFEALGYSIPVAVTSKDPAVAIQEIADQISLATGERMVKHSDSVTAATAKPNYILTATSDRAGVVLFLIPKGEDRYAVICSYRFEAIFPNQPSGPKAAGGGGST